MSNTSGTTFNCTYPASGTWFEIAFNIDLSNNIWEVFIDGVSQGSFSNSINQIASLDIFPINPVERSSIITTSQFN